VTGPAGVEQPFQAGTKAGKLDLETGGVDGHDGVRLAPER
jgi:hypothetical protein